MALYDVPIHTGYKVLTHTSGRRFSKNGFSQVGNTTLPAHPINPARVMRSSIYNKNLSLRGVSEAGYGRRYPNYGLSYAGAGSPRSSVLKDAYINDNPAPGTLGKVGIPGRQNSIRGLADDTDAPVDTGSAYGPAAPSNPGFFGAVSNVFSSIFGTAVSTTEQAGSKAIQDAIRGYITPPPSAPASLPARIVSAAGTTNVMGMAIPTTALLLGGGILAYVALRK